MQGLRGCIPVKNMPPISRNVRHGRGLTWYCLQVYTLTANSFNVTLFVATKV